MFHLLWMFLVGIVVGAIARLLMPGHANMGILMTGCLGVAGSFLGGFLSRLFSKPDPESKLHPAGIVMSVIGSLILLFAWSRFGR